MARHQPRWTLQLQTRREFLERSVLTAAWTGLAACGAGSDSRTVPSPQGSKEYPGAPNVPLTAYGPITPNEHFYITSYNSNPIVDSTTWALSVKSRGSEIARTDYPTLRKFPARTKEHTLECISAEPGYFAISNAVWTGLPLAEVFDAIDVTVPAGTVELAFGSVEGYTTSIPVADLDKPAWLVWLMNGVALPAEHGYPVRLLVPGRYGMKNPKWITSIDFVDKPVTGSWDQQGWSKQAPYKTNTLVHYPINDVPAGAVVASGTAFAGSDPIRSVEVSVDGGAWQLATLDYSPGPDIWTLWHFDMVLAQGPHSLRVRCTTRSGSQSGPGPQATDYLAGYDGSDLADFNAV